MTAEGVYSEQNTFNDRKECRERIFSAAEWFGVNGKTNNLIAWSEQRFMERKNWKDSIASTAIDGWAGGGGFSVFGGYKLSPEIEKELGYFIGRKGLSNSVWGYLSQAGGDTDSLIIERGESLTRIYYGWVPDSVSRNDTRSSANFLALSLQKDCAEWLITACQRDFNLFNHVVLPGLYPWIEVPLERELILDALRGLKRYKDIGKTIKMEIFLKDLLGKQEIEVMARYNKMPFFKRMTTSPSPAMVKLSEIDYLAMTNNIWGTIYSQQGDIDLVGGLDLTREDAVGEFGSFNREVSGDDYKEYIEPLLDSSWRVVRKGILRKPDSFVARAQKASIHKREKPDTKSILLITVEDPDQWNQELSNEELKGMVRS